MKKKRTNFEVFEKELLADPEIRQEYEALSQSMILSIACWNVGLS